MNESDRVPKNAFWVNQTERDRGRSMARCIELIVKDLAKCQITDWKNGLWTTIDGLRRSEEPSIITNIRH